MGQGRISQSEFDQVQQLFDRAIAQPAAIGLIVQTPWVMDGLSQVELDFAQRVSSQAADSPATVRVILQKSWVMDGVTGDEAAIVDSLLSIAAHESPTAPTEQTIAYRILNMPFLDSIEPYDPPAVVALTYIGSRSLEQLRRVVFHPSIPHGIHDHRAKSSPFFGTPWNAILHSWTSCSTDRRLRLRSAISRSRTLAPQSSP